MSQISQKSISGITSITTPAGVDNQFTIHTNNTSEALKLDHAGNIHIHNHVNTTGISSASNFKTGSSNLHSSGLSAASIDVGSNIKLGNAGVITATSFVGDGSDLTNLPAGLGTALSATATSPLNKMYYTNAVLGIAATTTVNVPASASAAYTQYADINIATDADLIIADGDDLIPDVLGLADFGTFGGGTAGRLRVDAISNQTANGAPNVQHGLVVTGVTTSTTFSGSGASLTNIPSAQLTGALPALDGSNLTGLSGVSVVNQANNRLITATGTTDALNGEAQLTFDGNKLITQQTNSDIGLLVQNTTHDSQLRIEAQAANKNSVIMFADGDDGDVGMIDYDHNDNSLSFTVNTSERLRIKADGKIGVNTPTPIGTLDVYDGSFVLSKPNSSGGERNWRFLNNNVSSGNLGLQVSTAAGGSTFSNVVEITRNGLIGIGEGTPDRRIHLKDPAQIKLESTGTGNWSGLEFMASSGTNNYDAYMGMQDSDGVFFIDNNSDGHDFKIDRSGRITTPSQPSFRITKSGGPFNTGGATVVWDNVIHNEGSHYNTSNGRFTAPVAGTYIFHYYSIYQYNSSNDLWDFKLNGSTFAGSRMHFSSGSVSSAWDNITNTQIIKLSANDYVEIYATDHTLHGGDWSHFCGHLLG